MKEDFKFGLMVKMNHFMWNL